jgi:hypothetical protein
MGSQMKQLINNREILIVDFNTTTIMHIGMHAACVYVGHFTLKENFHKLSIKFQNFTENDNIMEQTFMIQGINL